MGTDAAQLQLANPLVATLISIAYPECAVVPVRLLSPIREAPLASPRVLAIRLIRRGSSIPTPAFVTCQCLWTSPALGRTCSCTNTRQALKNERKRLRARHRAAWKGFPPEIVLADIIARLRDGAWLGQKRPCMTITEIEALTGIDADQLRCAAGKLSDQLAFLVKNDSLQLTKGDDFLA